MFEGMRLIFVCRYLHPRLTREELEGVIESYKRMGWWP